MITTASRSVSIAVSNSVAQSVQVSIYQKDFNLQRASDQVELLREMYNLAARLDTLSGELDPIKKGELLSISQAATKVISLSFKEKTKTSRRTAMPPIDEEGTQRG